MTNLLVAAGVLVAFVLVTALFAGVMLRIIISYEFLTDAFVVRCLGVSIWKARYSEIISVRRLSGFRAICYPTAAHLGTNICGSRVLIRRRRGINAIVTPFEVDAFIESIRRNTERGDGERSV